MRTVALLDPFSGGHHEWYLQSIAEAFVEQGWKVRIASPGATSVVSVMREPAVTAHVWSPDVKDGVFAWRRYWREANRAVLDLETEPGSSVDLVFFAWLDAFLGHGKFSRTSPMMPRHWAGLLFQPYTLRLPIRARWMRRRWLDPLEPLRSYGCRFVATLDEKVADTLEKRIEKKVVCFPDVASTGRIPEGLVLAQEMKERATRRTVVLLTGSIDDRKGLSRFIDAARSADPKEWFFVVAGPVSWSRLSGVEAEELRQSKESWMDHFWFALDGVLSEDAINECIVSSDAVWLSYENFPFSSNLLSKCAAFGVPAISNGEHLIGERVRRYNLGVIVPCGEEGTHFADGKNATALQKMRVDPGFQAGCAEFSAIHSLQALNRAIGEIVALGS